MLFFRGRAGAMTISSESSELTSSAGGLEGEDATGKGCRVEEFPGPHGLGASSSGAGSPGVFQLLSSLPSFPEAVAEK